nr:hypothetical protein [Tanacetum cinerariifolium]
MDDSRIDNEDESRDTTDEEDICKEDNVRSGEQGNEICQSNVSTPEPIVEATVNNENNVITANHVQSNQVNVDCKNYIDSYAKIVSSGNDELSKELIYIPTGVNENGNEVVIFEEELDPYVNFEKSEPSKIRIWIKLLNVPLEAWSVRAISALASRLGKPIMMDNTTAHMLFCTVLTVVILLRIV